MRLLFSTLMIVFAFMHVNALAQGTTKLITGIVVESRTNTPLEGVLVTIKGSVARSGSQPDGIYYIEVAPTDTVLVFSRQGYKTSEVRIGGDSEYNIRLQKLEVARLDDYECGS